MKKKHKDTMTRSSSHEIVRTRKMALDTLRKASSHSLSDIDRQAPNATDDSLASTKKPPSLNEITELYSALQDLVKISFTGASTPPKGSPKPLTSESPIDGSYSRQSEFIRQNSSSPLSTHSRKFSSSSSNLMSGDEAENVRVREIKDPEVRHRRGLSTGSIDAFVMSVENKASVSPMNKKKSSIAASTDDLVSLTSHRNHRSASSVNPKNKQDMKGLRLRGKELGKPEPKWKKGVFSRLRSRSSPWTGDGNKRMENSSPRVSNMRKLSQGQALSDSSSIGTDLSQSTSASSVGSSVQDIDQLCAALNIDGTTPFPLIDDFPLPAPSPENVVSRIEHWYQQATAQASMQGTDPETRVRRQSAPTGKNNRRESTITRKKFDRSPRHRKCSEDILHFCDLSKSTSKQRDKELLTQDEQEDEFSHSNDVSNPREKSINFKNSSEPSRRISLDDQGSGRLPKKPLFYIPSADSNTSGPNLTMVIKLSNGSDSSISSTELSKDRKTSANEDQDVFYTNPEDRSLGDYATMPRLRLKGSPYNDKSSKIISKELEVLSKSRPKSMYTESSHHKQTEDSMHDSTVYGNNVHTDNNGNLCTVKAHNMSLSMADVTESSSEQSQDKTFWTRLRSGKDKAPKNSKGKILNKLGGKKT